MNKELILMIVSLVSFVVITFILIFSKILKRETIVPFHDDELIKTNINENENSQLFYTFGETRKYVVKYILNTSEENKFVICNYKEVYKKIGFFIECFDKNKKLIKSYYYRDLNPIKNSSRIIPIDKRTCYTNIVISFVNDEVINNDIYLTLCNLKKNIFSSLFGFDIFCLLYTLRYFMFAYINPEYSEVLFDSNLGWFSIVIALIIGILAFIFSNICITKRNSKNKVGGIIDYDFN